MAEGYWGSRCIGQDERGCRMLFLYGSGVIMNGQNEKEMMFENMTDAKICIRRRWPIRSFVK